MNKPLIFTAVLTGWMAFAPPLQANEFALQWQQPLKFTLPAPTRSVLLEDMLDPQEWLAGHNIHNAQLMRQGRRTLAQFPMADDEWALRETALCEQIGVAACDAGGCASIQFQAETTNAANTEKVKARIIQTPPDVAEAEPLEDTGGVCRSVLAPPLAPPAGGGAMPNLTLDFSTRRDDGGTSLADPKAAVGEPKTTGIGGPPSSPEEMSPEILSDDVANIDSASAADQGPQVFELTDLYNPDQPTLGAADFQLRVEPNFADGATLASDQLPTDTTDYTLLVGEGCQSLQVPLSSVVPARLPNLIVALVTGDPAAIGAVHRLTPIKEAQLASSGDTLAVFYSARPVPQVLPLLRLDPNFLLVEPEQIFTTTAAPRASYSDPLAAFTYGPGHTGALELHGVSTGKGETVAVIDTGMALEHPDLAGRVTHEDFTEFGWSDDAHGTAVASIIAAAANNGLGSYGVAPEVSILALKACQPKAEGGLAAHCWTSTLVKALDAAITRDAKIINMSLAGPPDAIVEKYVALALSQNRLVVAGAGNGGEEALPAFPAALPGVLAVTAIDRNNRAYRDANQGAYIDLAAPGVDIITASPGESFPASSGTSWAAAHVSGVAALLRPLMPLATPADLAFLMRSEAKDLGAPGKDQQFGYGVVDACAAAAVATADAVTCGRDEGSVDGAE